MLNQRPWLEYPMNSGALLKTVTLGCKVNQYETEYLRQGLLQVGYQDAGPDDPVDLCVVNTCTVTNEGDSKSRQAIRKLNRQHPEARIVVMGCYATRAPKEILALPGVDEVILDKRELPDWLGRFGVLDPPTGISAFGSRQRAYIKVQDGCLLKCSYCIIPTVRPHMHSRPPEHILDEARRLIASGRREIVLTGIHLGHYGVDRNQGKPKSEWTRLSHLLQEIVELPGRFRVRLSSIEATEATPELIEVMAANPTRICPHLHVCLQSGSDRVLQRMKRRWGARRFLDCCARIRRSLDNPAFTTDVMVGFPGETEEDFQQTLAACEEVGFSKMHVFPFSIRKGTPAAEMDEQLPGPIKKERSQRLMELGEKLRLRYFQGLLGSTLEVLVEGPDESRRGWGKGTSCRYAPCSVPASDDQTGELISFQATEVVDGVLQGAPLASASAASSFVSGWKNG
ncbi:MAG: MiaB/RimO family radical SAM methylthiotransferase [Planctomycetales bacterium]